MLKKDINLYIFNKNIVRINKNNNYNSINKVNIGKTYYNPSYSKE